MKISLLTDAPKHNLALMKLSAYHKKKGDEVKLNMPLWKANYTYASYIFENSERYIPNLNKENPKYILRGSFSGGIAIAPRLNLPDYIEKMKPDYSLFSLRHSLGYTFRACFRKCLFCKVPLLPKDKAHHSIWKFHDPKFSVIELLNNNTFYDPLWEDTFMEIHEAGLQVIENGMDLRLLDDYKAWWIKRLKWKNQPKFAWDQIKDEKKIIEGMRLLQKHKIDAMVYVLMGFNTTFQEDLYRCEVINSMGFDPFPMLYKSSPQLRAFRRMIYLRCYRRYKTIKEAWKNFDKEVRNWKRRGNWRKESKMEANNRNLVGL